MFNSIFICRTKTSLPVGIIQSIYISRISRQFLEIVVNYFVLGKIFFVSQFDRIFFLDVVVSKLIFLEWKYTKMFVFVVNVIHQLKINEHHWPLLIEQNPDDWSCFFSPSRYFHSYSQNLDQYNSFFLFWYFLFNRKTNFSCNILYPIALSK
jgi:hypothetical protein